MMKTMFAILLSAIVAMAAPADGKVRKLQPADYDLWHETFVGSVSPGGRYLSYTTKHPGREAEAATTKHVIVDTMTGRKVFRFSGNVVPVGSYSRDSRWYAARDSAGVRLVDLESGEAREFAGGLRTGFTEGSDYFVVWGRSGDASIELGHLSVVGLDGSDGIELENVVSHELGTDGKTLAVVLKSEDAWEFRLIDLGRPLAVGPPLLTSSHRLLMLELGAEGAFALIEEPEPPAESGQVTHFFEWDEAIAGYRSYRHQHGTDGAPVRRVQRPRWHSSARGPLLVFGEVSTPAEPPGHVQIWHSMDARVVTDRKRAPGARHFAWWPRSDALVEVTDDRSTILFVTKQATHALVRSNGLDMLDSFEDFSGRFELVDLASGERTLLSEGGEGRSVQAISGSPCGRYVAYFADSRWWIHDLQHGTRNSVDAMSDRALLREDWDQAGHVPPHGSPGWTADGDLILYDRYDVWLVAPDGKTARRITDGRTDAKVYRIDRAANNVDLGKAVFDSGAGIVLSVFGESTKRSGYSIYREGAGVTDLVYEDALVERILQRPGLGFVHMRQRFDTPPEIVAVDASGKDQRILFRSNAHHADFGRRQARLIEYTGKSGKPLQGVLLYPSGYEAGKVYPMIVSIYQRQSHSFHTYHAPSRSSYMPKANYTGDGYFVLLPDIEYGPGGPGDWAVKSVTTAVEAALEVGRIDRDAIGLTGASWGGFQTLYIAGNSNLFATAVAGSAISDIVSNYLSLEPGAGYPTSWRYEMQQLRMHGPLHENFDAYVRNSPIFHARGISIPVLAWHGEQDDLISPSQAHEMYIMLRRMKRQHVLLLYPGESHVVTDIQKAIDLNARMKQWFDHYLKGVDAPEWILEGRRPG